MKETVLFLYTRGKAVDCAISKSDKNYFILTSKFKRAIISRKVQNSSIYEDTFRSYMTQKTTWNCFGNTGFGLAWWDLFRIESIAGLDGELRTLLNKLMINGI